MQLEKLARFQRLSWARHVHQLPAGNEWRVAFEKRQEQRGAVLRRCAELFADVRAELAALPGAKRLPSPCSPGICPS